MNPNEAAWLEYQVTMGDKLDLEKMDPIEVGLFRAIFDDGFKYGQRYMSVEQF